MLLVLLINIRLDIKYFQGRNTLAYSASVTRRKKLYNISLQEANTILESFGKKFNF
jgi:hypothetical protein